MSALDSLYLVEILNNELTETEQKNKIDPFVGYWREGDKVYYNWIDPISTVSQEIERGVYSVDEHSTIVSSPYENGYSIINVQYISDTE